MALRLGQTLENRAVDISDSEMFTQTHQTCKHYSTGSRSSVFDKTLAKHFFLVCSPWPWREVLRVQGIIENEFESILSGSPRIRALEPLSLTGIFMVATKKVFWTRADNVILFSLIFMTYGCFIKALSWRETWNMPGNRTPNVLAVLHGLTRISSKVQGPHES